jgi:neutral ceramidase
MKKNIYLARAKAFLRAGLLTCMYFLTLPVFAGDLKVGAAAVKITPPIGIPMAGQYFNRIAEGIHDDLYAKALVIDKDGKTIAIVSCDLLKVTAELVANARSLAAKSTGIAPDHMMICATHAHTGPILSSSSLLYTAKGESTEILETYLSKLPVLIAESIIKAYEDLKPANISFGLGHEESISFNRRFFMKDGTVGWNPGKLNPLIIKPAGPIDPDVAVLYAETIDGKAISTYVNFALHLDNIGGQEISADLPFTLSNILGNIKSREMVTLFGQGCCGNINNNNVNSEKPQYSHAEAQRLGMVLAGEVVKTYTRLVSFVVDKISIQDDIVKLPLAEISPNELPKAREIAARFGQPNAVPFMEMVNAYKIIDVYERNGKPLDTEIQVFVLGEKCAILGLPGEIFTELGMYIKSRSPFPYTMVVELANGYINYVPDRKAFIEGNYEPVSARCAPGSGEILVEKALRILNELKSK